MADQEDEVGRKSCHRYSCTATIAAHQWADANVKGPKWFHQKSGESWCPRHIPNWVEAWREKKWGKK